MPKIGLFSDSHEDRAAIAKAIEIFNQAGVDLVLHCGDLISPIMVGELRKISAAFHFVFGNNDGERIFLSQKLGEIGAVIHTGPAVLVHQDKKIIFMHEPVAVESLARSGDFDLVCYGHTHQLVNQNIKGCRLVNPGESCGLLSGRKTIMIMDFNNLSEVIDL